MLVKIILFILFCASLAEAKINLGLNDVSILIPLPKIEEDIALMIKPQEGLISEANLAHLVPLVSDDVTTDRRKSLKLIAFRIDPCFNEATPMACRRQLRLIFQPISIYSHNIFTIDAAVHAFYDFDEKTFASLLEDWKATLTDGQGNDPLQIHPVLRAQGLRGPLWNTYRNIILKYCSDRNLTRLTQSTVDRFGMNWDFLGFDINADGSITKIKIPRTNVTKQIFFTNGAGSGDFSGEILPPMSKTDPDWANFFDHSARQPKSVQEEAVRRAFEFENPEKFNTANLDCVSCHLAHGVRLWGEINFSGWEQDPQIRQSRFTSSRNLELVSRPVFFTNRVRAFGYFMEEPNISPRVINETALTADALEKFLQH